MGIAAGLADLGDLLEHLQVVAGQEGTPVDHHVNLISASGDHGGSNLGTFNPLFPRGAYFNEAALIGPQNLMDLQPGIELTLAKSAKLTASCDFVWRESLDDGVYGVALNLQVPPGASDQRYVGTFPSLSFSWQAGRHLNLALHYVAYLFGDFVKESAPNQANGNYVSAVATFRF